MSQTFEIARGDHDPYTALNPFDSNLKRERHARRSVCCVQKNEKRG